MKFTKGIFRALATMNFLAFLAKSNLSYTFSAMVCSPSSVRPLDLTGPTRRHRSSVFTFSCTYLVKSPQSSPAVGISFCLIIVRLGHVLPVAREESWDTSAYTPASRTGGSGRVAVSFPQIKIRRDVYVNESKDLPMGTLEAQERGYVNSSAGLPKIFRSSPSVSTLT